jgi:hypothetical protein
VPDDKERYGESLDNYLNSEGKGEFDRIEEAQTKELGDRMELWGGLGSIVYGLHHTEDASVEEPVDLQARMDSDAPCLEMEQNTYDRLEKENTDLHQDEMVDPLHDQGLGPRVRCCIIWMPSFDRLRTLHCYYPDPWVLLDDGVV